MDSESLLRVKKALQGWAGLVMKKQWIQSRNKEQRFKLLERRRWNSISQFSRSIVSDSSRPYEPMTRPPCPSPSPRACSSSCPLSRWCHPTISASVTPFSCPQSSPASWSLPMSRPKYWSFSFSISPSNEYPGLISYRMNWLDLLTVQGTLKSLSSTTVWKHHFFGAQPSLWSNFHIIHYFRSDCGDHNKLCKILKDMGKPDHLTGHPRNWYSVQEATVRTGHRTMNWLKIGKGLQGCILSSCLLNLYEEYIIWNTGLDEAQAGIKISRRNISNFRYAAPEWQKAKRN